jgi:type II secretory pathway pseudopilin PulG
MVTNIRNGHRGFTYLAVLILLVLLTGALAAAGTRWATVDQRNRETALLQEGAAVRAAIGMYYENTPGTVKRYPPTLQALLRDTRFLGMRRYLRRVPSDPMTRQAPFVLMAAPDGGVMGIHSRSDKAPFKSGNFSRLDASFSGASHFSEWQFIYVPSALPSTSTPSAKPSL